MISLPSPWEQELQELGRQILDRMGKERPSVFRKDYWGGKLIDWCLRHPSFKVQLLHFVDVLPALRTSRQLGQHLKEYLSQPGVEIPPWLQKTISSIVSNPVTAPLAAQQLRRNIEALASIFIVGKDPQDALPKLRALWDSGIFFTVDLLGEATVSEREAEDYLHRYLELMDFLGPEMAQWPSPSDAREDHFPRLSVSVKPSSLFSQMDPVNFQGSVSSLKERLRPIFRKATELGAFVNLDMESFSLCEITISAFKELLEEEEFRHAPKAGIVLQTYLTDYKDYLTDLINWARRNQRQITLRIVKGAYWDYEQTLARWYNLPVPVFLQKGQTDSAFEEATRICLSQYPLILTAVATHNLRSISHAMVAARSLGLPKEALEIQMLYGMAEPIKRALVEMGYYVCYYCPIGDLLPGMAYLVRRLLENTSNESFLKKGFYEGASWEELMGPPRISPVQADQVNKEGKEMGPFVNTPPTDFARETERGSFAKAVKAKGENLGKVHPILIDWKEVKTRRKLLSLNPARPSQVVGQSYLATKEEAERALESAYRHRELWMETPVDERVAIVLRAAQIMRAKRNELASLMIYEVSKTWTEADADVCEAIDFCEYYAREMLRLGRPILLDPLLPGEVNEYLYEPRGVTIVIAPWNFPLAISTGMVIGALVTGNPVVYKPSSNSPVTGAALAQILREAGVPKGVFHFLPTQGEEAARWLVEDHRVATVAFTGSKDVGLEIVLRAAPVQHGQEQVKRVIAEMGGKNAIIVDSDADLDAAVVGVMQSAFGFQGQKCSACSRVIVLEDQYNRFVERLIEAARSIKVGDPVDPSVQMGALIDSQAKKKVEGYIRVGMDEGNLLFQGECPGEGFFVPPTIFGDIRPEHRLAQEEIFGPVLSVMKAEDLDHALEIANSTPYALTGGLYSRSPANIGKVKRKFRVGNLYINRKITGSLVGRQPFGGFKMSGVGSKAGGPDYLLQFMEPRTITENTLRRGFAPEPQMQ